MAQLARKTARLRFRRLSLTGSYYFVTCCTKDRDRVLTERQTAAALVEVLRSMETSQDIVLAAATIMPDHVHLLFALGARLRIGQVIGKMKALACRRAVTDWVWQEESFEHQVRLNDSLEDYGFYVFMNPYRAGLCSLSERWSWWICPEPGEFGFLAHLEGGKPVPEEWIGRSKEIADRIGVRR